MKTFSSDSRIHVAGHTGMVGAAIVRKLRAQGCSNLVLRTHAELDLTDQKAVDHFYVSERPEFVFLAAARVGGIHANNTYPAEFIHDNLAIQTNIIHSAWKHGANKLLFLGSSCIYPRDCPQPIREEYLLTGPLEQTNEPYAIAKIAGLKMCQAYRRQYGFDTICAMPTNLYGPGDNYHPENSHVVPALLRRFDEARRNDAPEVVVWGTGTPLREFLHVDDLADALVTLMQRYSSEEPVNVGSGDEVSIAKLAQLIAETIGYEGEIRFDASKPDGTPRKLLDSARIGAVGWYARIGLEHGLQQTVAAYASADHDTNYDLRIVERTSMPRIPVYQPDLSGNERKYVLECMDSTWISSKGRFIHEFEAAFAQFVGIPNAVSVCNGTVALHLALLALGIGPGDEVIVPSLTYIASVNAIHYVGATPVFCDSLADTWQMDSADVARRITPRTRAVMAVHLYGGACEMGRIVELCERHDLKLIEDCAEAIGTKWDGNHVGTFGDMATFSFFGNKTLTTGEGGMVVCKNQALDAKLRHLRGQGLAANREYWHDIIGYNYRMTNICAAIGLAQLERAIHILPAKIALAQRYQSALANVPVMFQKTCRKEMHSQWMVTVLVPTALERDPLRAALAKAGVETRPVFHPAHTMPMYARADNNLPIACDIATRGINLPSWPGLDDDQFTLITSVIESAPWAAT